MEVFLVMFGGSNVSVCFCITHADKHTQAWREKTKEQLLRHPDLKAIIEKEKMDIVFMGCVDTHDKVYISETQLEEDYKKVYQMRKNLLEIIFDAKEKKMLNQMNVARKKIEEVATVMDQIVSNFHIFASCGDFGTSKIQETIIIHREKINYLSENSVYMNVPELADKFVTLFQAASKFKEKEMDKVLKTSLLWPLKLREEIDK